LDAVTSVKLNLLQRRWKVLDGEGKEKQRACLVGLLSSLASCKSCYSDQGARARGEKNSGFSQLLVYLEKREKQLQLRHCLVHPKTKIFSRFSVISNLAAHAWRIKYR
jgi:hypothetical protein